MTVKEVDELRKTISAEEFKKRRLAKIELDYHANQKMKKDQALIQAGFYVLKEVSQNTPKAAYDSTDQKYYVKEPIALSDDEFNTAIQNLNASRSTSQEFIEQSIWVQWPSIVGTLSLIFGIVVLIMDGGQPFGIYIFLVSIFCFVLFLSLGSILKVLKEIKEKK